MSESVSYTVNRPEVIDEAFDDEYVIVNLSSGAYYGLRGSATLIWELVASGATQDEIVTRLTAEFDADPTTLSPAVADLLRELEQEALITSQSKPSLNPPSASAPQPHPATGKPFVPPILEKHVDMQQVLQLDPIHEVDQTGWPSPRA